MSPADVARVLERGRYRVSTEALLQADIAHVLEAAGLPFGREVRLSKSDRIDFVVAESIGIEAKTRCNKRSIWRQIERYATHESISALILITGTPVGLPPEVNGKPLYFVSLGRTFL